MDKTFQLLESTHVYDVWSISGRESLRDLLITVSAHSNKYYHLGFGKNVSRTNLAIANEQRNYCIYESFAYEMIAIARSCVIDEPILPF